MDSLDTVLEREPFVLIKFDSAESVSKILAQKHEISKKDVIVEYLHNFDLLNEAIKLNEVNPSKLQKLDNQKVSSSKLFQSRFPCIFIFNKKILRNQKTTKRLLMN